ncbi:MAG: DUF1640 domain-containing protein [Gemmatimonadetes bacterium]|nr:DUF1640 domain-containing protein [Gemmatimonadota bacterium]
MRKQSDLPHSTDAGDAVSYYPIDTHATVREFEAAGIETRQAEAIVKAMTWSRNDLVTKTDLAGFATKEDLAGFATKEDLERFATKEDFELCATKEDLERYATKEDLVVLRAEMAAMKSDLEKQISGAVIKMMICMISMSALIVGMMKYL